MSKYRKYIIGFIGLVILVLFYIYFSNIVWWLLISGFIAAISSPIVKLLDKIHFGRFQMPRWVSAMITTILIWGVLVLFVVLTVPFVGKQIAHAVKYLLYLSIVLRYLLERFAQAGVIAR